MALRTEVSPVAGWTVVSVYGELDISTAPSLRETIVELVNGGDAHLVLDLEALDFLDSTGLGTIIGGLKRARAHGGDLRLVCTQDRVCRVFEITGLDAALPLHASLADAVDRG